MDENGKSDYSMDNSNYESNVHLTSSQTGETYSSIVTNDPLDSPDEDVHIIIKSDDDPKPSNGLKPSNGFNSKVSKAFAPLLHEKKPLPANSTAFEKFRHSQEKRGEKVDGKKL